MRAVIIAGLLASAAPALAQTGPHGHGSANSAPRPGAAAPDRATIPARTPPTAPSEEVDRQQLDLARQEGNVHQRQVDYMVEKVAHSGARQRAGDYIVAYAQEKAEGMYMLRGGKLEWTEVGDENCHLEISVSDAGDRRFVPGLSITATLVAANGQEVGPFEVPFVWHPGLYHYGRNVKVPGSGTYTLRVRIEPPAFMRHDKDNGLRYAEPVEVTFTDVSVKAEKG